jgi:hypothetical protein
VPIVLAGGDHSVGLLNPTIADSLRQHGWIRVTVEVIANADIRSSTSNLTSSLSSSSGTRRKVNAPSD